MKYRIVQKGDKFYPQVKSFLFWSPIVSWNAEGFLKVECWSYEEALSALKEIKDREEREPETRTVHKVIL